MLTDILSFVTVIIGNEISFCNIAIKTKLLEFNEPLILLFFKGFLQAMNSNKTTKERCPSLFSFFYLIHLLESAKKSSPCHKLFI